MTLYLFKRNNIQRLKTAYQPYGREAVRMKNAEGADFV
jgi:hypothetical protein